MSNFLIIPYSIINISELKISSRILLAQIIALSKKDGRCFATNEFLSKCVGISKRSVAYSINELLKKDYIEIERKHKSRFIKINSAKPALKNASIADQSANIAAQSANIAHNNNNYNNKYNNNYNNKKNSSYDLAELMVIK